MAVDYGIDSPRTVKELFWRAATFAGLGVAIYAMNRAEYPGPALTLMAVFVVAGLGFLAMALYMRQASLAGKLQMRDRLLDRIQWTGDEKVLDVGCGRGLLAIGAAKRLKKGRVTGIDIWSAEDLSGNTLEAANANAKAEGVADKVKIENGDARKLTYGDKSFDVVVSSLVLHNIADGEERSFALSEMLRVLKPGGHIAIFDIRSGEYAAALREAGANSVDDSDQSFLKLFGGRFVVGRKAAA